MEKRELRQVLRARRRRLPRWRQQQAARRVALMAVRQAWYRHARAIAFYLANDGEIDPQPLLRRARADGKRIFLPRLRQRRLEFVAHGESGPMRRNRFGILEPLGKTLAPHRLDAVCMPLVGFDRQGRRLGMGGGFYDRTFAAKARKYRHGPRLIGLAHACQQVAQVPHDSWDVQLMGVVTERKWIRARRF